MTDFQKTKFEMKGPEVIVVERCLSDDTFIFDFDSNVYKMGKCEGCLTMDLLLTKVCECKQVSYCSQECLEKDVHWHKKYCEFENTISLNNFKLVEKQVKSQHGLVGIANLGNTCYLNSAV